METGARKRHCWGCRRRYVVCDFTEPACWRCSASGVACPGYDNTCILRDLIPTLQLGQNPYIHHASPTYLREASATPDFLQLGVICMALCHRINQLGARDISQSNVLVERYYLFRGNVLRSLSMELNSELGCTSDIVVAGTLTLLLLDIQSGAAPHWLHHLRGAQKLVSLRGGFQNLAASQALAPLLNCLWLVGIMTNTTCPTSHLDTSVVSHLRDLEFMLEPYGFAMTPSKLWHPQLLAEVVRINNLRFKSMKRCVAGAKDLAKQAFEILGRIQDFSPEQAADSRPSSRQAWTQIGYAHKSAVALYCVLSLQSVSIFPRTLPLRATCAEHGQNLRYFLSRCLSSPRTQGLMLWPLVVLGVEAVHGDAAMRAFVAQQLPEVSRFVGTSVPLTAQAVLSSFWASGHTSWDACFVRPYPFTTQIAVDVSQVMASR
ncbi:hypothetical protein CCHL11_02181 [Colletotrichum chlorophyti]|uniref:Zn(2)-C6 fungal-type domain-containing protein n=1 Tax=Colletotrichum chlorophyti TaxID=708187 RepID=A0A1Q8S6S3_9PEZI|nr:hypothetical protein CCHL11_02181 [Colletotrichum chlorophyti]